MTTDQVKSWFGRMWQDYMPEIYQEGVLNNSLMVLSTMHQFFSQAHLPELKAWLAPTIAFPSFQKEDYLNWETFYVKKKLLGQSSDLILTYKQEVKAVLKLNYKAGGYGNHVNDLAFLDLIHKIRGTANIYLAINPKTGLLETNMPFSIAEDVLLVYAVVNQESSFSLDLSHLKEFSNNSLYWYHFLLLKGRIGDAKISFSMVEGHQNG
ncbi:MAG: hypothetical protein AAFY71_13740 [Bacteroidota bacterium]